MKIRIISKQSTFLLLLVSLIFTIMTSGCANSRNFHRDADGVLKTETRTNTGIYKGDN